MCAAPVNNQFWKLRSKHGRNKLFASAELLWEAACEYFQWCDENPLMEVDFRGKDAVEVKLPKMRAYTIEGLCLYLDASKKFLSDFEDRLKGKQDEGSKDFITIITRIRAVIYDQKFTGAAAGFLNANIIARDLGLKDKSDLTTDDKPIQSINIQVIDSKIPLSSSESAIT